MATIEKRDGSNGVRYRVRVRIKGETPRTRTFKRKSDAELWAKKVESDLGHGVYVPTTMDRRRTVGDLIDKYLREKLGEGSDARNVKRCLNWWKAQAGELSLDRLTPQTIASLRSDLLARKVRRSARDNATDDDEAPTLAHSTANRYLAALSAVCKWGWKELGWMPANPVLSVSKGPEHTGIIRYLSDDERKALLTASKESTNPNIHCAIVLALATGARASNIRFLKWEDVDRTRWTLCFRQTKNKEPRYVPVVGPAQRVLQAQFDNDATGTGWVFKGARDEAPADLETPWRAVRAAAGLTGEKHLRFHDLRHTTASYLTMNGATLAEVAEALGHRTLMMAKRYSHQSGEHVRATLERMASRFLQQEEEATAPGEPRDH